MSPATTFARSAMNSINRHLTVGMAGPTAPRPSSAQSFITRPRHRTNPTNLSRQRARRRRSRLASTEINGQQVPTALGSAVSPGRLRKARRSGPQTSMEAAIGNSPLGRRRQREPSRSRPNCRSGLGRIFRGGESQTGDSADDFQVEITELRCQIELRNVPVLSKQARKVLKHEVLSDVGVGRRLRKPSRRAVEAVSAPVGRSLMHLLSSLARRDHESQNR